MEIQNKDSDISRRKMMFQNKKLLPVLALAATFSWGCAFPLIKLGLAEFQIDPQSTGSKALFAGIRFFLAGFVVLILERV